MHILCWNSRHIFVLLRPPGQAAKDLLMQKYIYSERLERSASSGTIFDSKFRLEIEVHDTRDLFRIQLAPTFFGVLCGTYEGITKEKVIFSFSMWDSPTKN